MAVRVGPSVTSVIIPGVLGLAHPDPQEQSVKCRQQGFDFYSALFDTS
jgi:hypothetical protein